MSQYDHSPQRLIDAQRELLAAEQHVTELVMPYLEAFAKLYEWKDKPIGFREDRPDGTSSIPETSNQINLNEMPFLKPIAESMVRYRKALGAVRGAEEALPRN